MATPALVLAVPALAQDAATPGPPRSEFTTTLGGTVWEGDYGAPTDTHIQAAILGARYRFDGLRLSATIPYMRIRSNGTIFTGIGATPLFVAPTVSPGRRVRKGVGDLTLGASYLLPARGVDIEFTGRVKLPTASRSSGLSTRQTDYSAGVDIAKPIGRLVPHVGATYRWFGESRTLRFKNGFDVVAGFAYVLPSRITLVANYEYTQRASRLIGDAHEVVAAASVPLSARLRLSGFTSAGLSRGATDISAGASLAFTL